MTEQKLVADDGEVWVCPVCGKTAKHRWGYRGHGHVDQWWDESCAIHAVLCKEPKTGELWEAIPDAAPPAPPQRFGE